MVADGCWLVMFFFLQGLLCHLLQNALLLSPPPSRNYPQTPPISNRCLSLATWTVFAIQTLLQGPQGPLETFRSITLCELLQFTLEMAWKKGRDFPDDLPRWSRTEDKQARHQGQVANIVQRSRDPTVGVGAIGKLLGFVKAGLVGWG